METPAAKDLEDQRTLVASAENLAGQGRTDEALERLLEVLKSGEVEPKLLFRAGDVAETCGAAEVASSCWQALCELQPWHPKWPRRLARTAEQRADYSGAYRIAREALERWPNDPGLRRQTMQYGALSGQSNSWGHDALALAADEAMPDKTRLKAASYLVGLGMVEAARTALLSLTGRELEPAFARAVATELTAIDILEAAGPTASRAVPGYLGSGRPVVIHRSEGSPVTMLVFSVPSGAVGVPTNVFHALVAPLAINVVYFFDEDRVVHLNGNRAFGVDYMTTLDRLRDMLAAWETKRLLCIGMSAGGTAAIRYGLDLGAERILAFGAATTLDPQVIWDQGRARSIITRMKRIVPHMLKDFRPELERASPAPQVDLYYAPEHPGDRAYAEHLADMPTVCLHPVERADQHNIINDLVLRDQLRPILVEAIDPCLHLLEHVLPEW